MFKLLDIAKNDIIAIKIDGKIEKSDYEKITPLIEKTVRDFGKFKLFIQIDTIKGMEPSAIIEDVKTYLKHFRNVSKIAVVGENAWQKMWTDLAGPFISGKTKFFPEVKISEAINWINE